MIQTLRYAIATVWIAFGFGAKVLGFVPRHQAILARALDMSGNAFLQRLAARHARALIVLIGVGETLVGMWMASGLQTRACVLLQTVVILTMNSIELATARDLLLFPLRMVLLNAALLSAAWWVAWS